MIFLFFYYHHYNLTAGLKDSSKDIEWVIFSCLTYPRSSKWSLSRSIGILACTNRELIDSIFHSENRQLLSFWTMLWPFIDHLMIFHRYSRQNCRQNTKIWEGRLWIFWRRYQNLSLNCQSLQYPGRTHSSSEKD